MATVACRDSGQDCDWFFKGEDAGVVLIEDNRHGLTAHPENFAKVLVAVKSGALTFSKFATVIAAMVKDIEKRDAKAACSALVLDCPWTASTSTVPDAWVEWVKHFEEAHPDEMMRMMTPDEDNLFIRMLKAIERP
jgi:predicted small metal-binding protein